MNGGWYAVSGALALFAIGASQVAAQKERHATDDRAYADAARAAAGVRARAFEAATRARPEDGALARVRAWSRAIEIDPSWGEARVELANAHLDRAREIAASDAGGARGEREACVRDADEAVARGAGARAFYAKGRALEELGDAAQSKLAYFESARTATWDDAFVRHAALAAIALADGRAKDALDESSRALEESPNAPDATSMRARAQSMIR
jgi:hypothetical protein